MTHQIGYAMTRLRGTWICLTLASLLFIVAISSYPVHPHKEILVLGWIIIGAVVITTFRVFLQINRNEVLSLLARTTPNQLTWDSDLLEKLVWFAGIPIFGLVAAQFPEVAHFLAKVIEPLVRGSH